jgi:hypothetical protein
VIVHRDAGGPHIAQRSAGTGVVWVAPRRSRSQCRAGHSQDLLTRCLLGAHANRAS